jgi:uncharacterized protein YndB with AHSA1/START domain
MSDREFTTSFSVDESPDAVFAAITDVRGWWTGDVNGETESLGDEFTYRYGDTHYSRQKITELVPGKRVVWRVTEANLNFAEDPTEWVGTEMTFDISRNADQTELRFAHVGLVPQFECFDACSNAWGSLINGSLRRLITSGEGPTAPA